MPLWKLVHHRAIKSGGAVQLWRQLLFSLVAMHSLDRRCTLRAM
jgi:hypothetical protein